MSHLQRNILEVSPKGPWPVRNIVICRKKLYWVTDTFVIILLLCVLFQIICYFLIILAFSERFIYVGLKFDMDVYK